MFSFIYLFIATHVWVKNLVLKWVNNGTYFTKRDIIEKYMKIHNTFCHQGNAKQNKNSQWAITPTAMKMNTMKKTDCIKYWCDTMWILWNLMLLGTCVHIYIWKTVQVHLKKSESSNYSAPSYLLRETNIYSWRFIYKYS